MPTSPEIHFEPFLHLVDVGAEEALIAWGGFYFRRGDSPYGEWRIVDDEELREVAGERSGTIGFSSEPYGEAVVEVEREGEVVATVETASGNFAWVRGLEPATEYRYRVILDGEPWAEGELWDWDLERRTLVPSGRRYENRFRTFPAASAEDPVRFAVLGDFGVGILASDENAYRQTQLAGALGRACEDSDVLLVLTTGDNVYLGPNTTGSGNEDDDWYASFYEPYRYVINRVPVFPTVGNHDAADTESSDDRDQLADNFYLEQRFRPAVEAGRASLEPGLFYCLRAGLAEFVCVDTSLAGEIGREHFFDDPAHFEWLERALAAGSDAAWRIPFSHHPPFCAGPEHGNTEGMVERLVPLYERAGVRLVLSGHEHNFQHSRVNGIDYVVSGAAGKLRAEEPTDFAAAGTRAWAAAGHILLVDLERERAVVHPVAGVADDGSLEEIELRRPDNEPVRGPIEIPAQPSRETAKTAPGGPISRSREGGRLPESAHTSRPWRLHELTPDFRVEDVWALPTPGGPDDFPRLMALATSLDPAKSSSGLVRALFAIRWKVGGLLGWDEASTGLGSRVPTLRERLPDDLREAPAGPELEALPFTPLYRLEDEFAAEVANGTMHGVLHLGWVADGSGGYRGQMAVLVKPNGLPGKAYMASIAPFRHLIVYPRMMREFGRAWRRQGEALSAQSPR